MRWCLPTMPKSTRSRLMSRINVGRDIPRIYAASVIVSSMANRFAYTKHSANRRTHRAVASTQP